MKKKIKLARDVRKELIRFLLIGISAVLVDLFVYLLMIKIGLSINISKAISFCSGAIVSYQANRLWTFKIKTIKLSNTLLFIILYGLSLIINVFMNSFIIFVYREILSIQIAFVTATLFSATFNFFGLKLIVFNRK